MRRTTPRFLRRALICSIGALASVAALAACVDPGGAYDDFRSRTDGQRGVNPQGNEGTDGGVCKGPVPGTAPDFSMTGVPDVNGTYYTACLATIALCDTAQALHFRIDQTVDASGNLTQKVSPLLIGATSIGQTVGTPFDLPGTMSNDGTWTLSGANKAVAGAANPYSHNDITIDPVVFHGHVLSGDRMCAELDGTVKVLGTEISLDGPGDVCIYVRATEGQTFDFKLEDFHCP